ncbi:MAG: transposase [Phycisphaeraceae bacterium]
MRASTRSAGPPRVAWRVADSLSLRQFLGIPLDKLTPDHSTLSRTRRLAGPANGGAHVPLTITTRGTQLNAV